ncbi:MAG: peroxiredoxin-like family protein [bacterium]|nr:peroxiredoxin-like family protein [bacterium]
MKKILTLLFMLIYSLSIARDNPKIADSPETIDPVKTGQKIPSVNVKNIDGRVVSLDSIVSSMPTVLVFYRGGWCPYCNVQLSGLQKIESELINLGYQIVAVSADKSELLSETVNKEQINFTLLSDFDGMASVEFGIAYKVSDEYYSKLKDYNLDLETVTGNKNHILPVPSVFIIDTSGKINFEYINPDYKVRLDPDELLANAKSFAN